MGSPATNYLQVVKGSCDLLFEFWDPLHISRMVGARNFMVQARNFKFGTKMDHERFLQKKINIRLKGQRSGHVTYS